jgi:hypothetical protein
MRKFLLLLSLIVSSASAFAFSGAYTSPTNYRWRADDGNQATATWTENENTPHNVSGGVGQNLRLRIGYAFSSPAAAPGQSIDTTAPSRLQYLDPATNIWITISGSTSNAFVMGTSLQVAGGTPTTTQLTPSGTPAPGAMVDAGGPFVFSYHTDGNTTTHYEMEWIIQPTVNAVSGTYTFRMNGERSLGLPGPIAQLNYTQQVFNYTGSPFCGTTGTGSPTNGNAPGGVYTSDAGLVIDPTSGDVDIAASTAGLHTVTYTFGIAQTVTAQVAIRPQIASTTGLNNVGNQVACAGANFPAVTFSSPIENLTFNWTNSNSSIGLAPAGSGDIAGFTGSNNGIAPAYAQINVKASGGTGCTFRNMAFRYTVNPIPTVNVVPDQFYCRGIVTDAIGFSGSTVGTSYIWGTSQPLSGMPQRKGTNVFPSFTTGNTPGATTVTVTPSYVKCLGTPINFQVVINNCTAQPGDTGNGDARMSFDRQFTASPNPTSGIVHVQYTGTAQQLFVIVRDAFGTVLQPSRRASGRSITVDLSNLRPGTYAIQLVDPATGASVTRTIVKM